MKTSAFYLVLSLLIVAVAVGLITQAQALPSGARVPAVMGDDFASGTSDFQVQVPAGFYDLTISVSGNALGVIVLPELAEAAYDTLPVGASESVTWSDIYIEGFKVDRTSAASGKWFLEKAGR